MSTPSYGAQSIAIASFNNRRVAPRSSVRRSRLGPIVTLTEIQIETLHAFRVGFSLSVGSRCRRGGFLISRWHKDRRSSASSFTRAYSLHEYQLLAVLARNQPSRLSI